MTTIIISAATMEVYAYGSISLTNHNDVDNVSLINTNATGAITYNSDLGAGNPLEITAVNNATTAGGTNGNITITEITGDIIVGTTGNLAINTGTNQGIVNITANAGSITVNGNIGELSPLNGVVTLRTETEEPITINGTVDCFRIILITGDTTNLLSSGTVTIAGALNIRSPVQGCIQDGALAAGYIFTGTLLGAGPINLSNGGKVCVSLLNIYNFTGNVSPSREHICHCLRTDRNVVYRPGLVTNNPAELPSVPFVYYQADLNLGDNLILDARGNGNVYIIGITSTTVNANTRSVTVTTYEDEYIEFRGEYTSTGNLTLTPGRGGIRLDNVNINLSNSMFEITNHPLLPPNDNQNVLLLGSSVRTNIIRAAGIRLGGTITNEVANIANHLTLDAAANTISITGNVGNLPNQQLGNIVVNNTNPVPGAVTFLGAVYANNFTQTGSGSTIFQSQQDYYSGNFSFTGTNLTATGNMTVAAGDVIVESSGSVIFNGNMIVAAGGVIIESSNSVAFNGNVSANGYTQTGTGSTTFNGLQNYSGNFSFTGNTLTVNRPANTETMTVGGLTTIDNSGPFTLNAPLTSTGSITKSGIGNSFVGADITTTNAGAAITFNNLLTFTL
jgi:hypothetical protein